jgi:outer membrane protein assembly factor BamB
MTTRLLWWAAAVVVFSACASAPAPSPSDSGPPAPRLSWTTYQHSSDRNAVFEHYKLSQDWSYNAKTQINSGLALIGNTLLFTTFSHKLVALDVRNGHIRWQAPVSNIAMSTPIVAGNTVYIGTGKSGVLDRSWNPALKIQFAGKDVWGVPGGDEIAAFDLRTGARLWTHRTVGEDMPSAVYHRGRLIFANGDWHAYALRADNGRQLWSTDIGGVSTMASAVMAGNTVIVAICNGGMKDTSSIALDASTGKMLWKSPYGHCDAAPAYADGKVFVSDVDRGDSRLQGKTIVAALDARTGKPIWLYRGKAQGLWSIVGSDEAAVAGTYASGTYYQSAPFDDQVIAFDAETGKVRWRFHTSGPVKMSPVVAKQRLYVGDTVGLLYTLDARSGALLEIRSFKQPFTTSPPIVAGTKLLVVNGTSVHSIPLSGRPNIPERVGLGITTLGMQSMQQ